MDIFLGAIGLAAFTGWLVHAVSSGAIDRAVSAFAALLGGWRQDAWPRGVQEEDRDRPWGSAPLQTPKPLIQALIEPTGHSVATGRVLPKTRSR